MKTPLKFSIPVLCSLLIASCGVQQEQEKEIIENEVEATAPDANEPEQQGYALPGLNHGLLQSPINIDTKSMGKEGKHKITMNFKDEVNKIENLGHTVQLDFAAGSSISADDTTFNFVQCHFHTPSEHLIDGMTYPLEMHVVNVMPGETEKETTQYLVIGLLFKEGAENKFLAEFINKIPKDEKASTDVEVGTVQLADLFGATPADLTGSFYHYRGSLTTPPFTESVRWYLMRHIYEASAAQIEALNKIEGNNARHVQAAYGRLVSAD